jgi:UDPglucose 6-dehydrogenase
MRIAVIGTGYVGLVSGTCFAEIGHDVICVDVHPEKIEKLKKGIMPIHEDGLEDMVKRHHALGSLRFTTDYAEAIPGSEVVLIAVGTPSSADGAADLRFVFQAAEEIGKHLTDYTVIVNKSTVPIGTADQVTQCVNKHANHAFDVVSNPEILREGIAVNDFMNPSRIIIGSSSSKATEKMLELYAPLACQKLIMSTRVQQN